MSTLGKKELILLAIIASIAGFFFYDFLVENVLAVILSIFGLGGVFAIVGSILITRIIHPIHKPDRPGRRKFQ